MNAAGSLYFADEGYLTWQKNLVEPYLKQCQKYAYFHSYDGAAIFYQQYLAAGGGYLYCDLTWIQRVCRKI